jgi:hypothetical protein
LEADMTPNEKALIEQLFLRIRATQVAGRDPEADRLIADEMSRTPGAAYALAQTVLVQDHALREAHERLSALEEDVAAVDEQTGGGETWGGRRADASQGSGVSQGLGGAGQGSGAGQAWGRAGQGGGGPSPSLREAAASSLGSILDRTGLSGRRGAVPRAGAATGEIPASEGVDPARGSAGGGFLQGALQTAAGVAGGALLFQGIKSLFGGEEGGAAGASGASPWGDAKPALGDDQLTSAGLAPAAYDAPGDLDPDGDGPDTGDNWMDDGFDPDDTV